MKFTILTYDVWRDNDDFVVNDFYYSGKVQIDDTDTGEDVLQKLVQVGYLDDTNDMKAEWMDDYWCEISHDGRPVCKLIAKEEQLVRGSEMSLFFNGGK